MKHDKNSTIISPTKMFQNPFDFTGFDDSQELIHSDFPIGQITYMKYKKNEKLQIF